MNDKNLIEYIGTPIENLKYSIAVIDSHLSEDDKNYIIMKKHILSILKNIVLIESIYWDYLESELDQTKKGTKDEQKK